MLEMRMSPPLTATTDGGPAPGPDVRPARLAAEQYAQHFADAAPRLSRTQALVEAERCLYCFDAPCANSVVPVAVESVGDPPAALSPVVYGDVPVDHCNRPSSTSSSW